MVVMGVKMIYVPWMPGHRKRLTQTYVDLLKRRCMFVAFNVKLVFPSHTLSHAHTHTYTHHMQYGSTDQAVS